MARLTNQQSVRFGELALCLKEQFEELLIASPAFGRDKRMTKAIDGMRQIVKEIEDLVVFARVQDSDPKQTHG